MAHACAIAHDELGCGIEPQREICEKAVCGKTPVDPFLLLECCEKRQEEKEEQCVEHAHEALERGEVSGDYLVPSEIERLKTYESQRSRDKSQEYTCEVVSSHISPYIKRSAVLQLKTTNPILIQKTTNIKCLKLCPVIYSESEYVLLMILNLGLFFVSI